MRDRYYRGCKYIEDDDRLIISMGEYGELDSSIINGIIKSYNFNNITILNIINSRSLKNAIESSKSIKINGNITIDLNSNISEETNRIGEYKESISNLDSSFYINLDDIPSNVILKGFNKDNSQNAFTIWVHNLDDNNKNKILKLLQNDEKVLLVDEELVIRDFYTKIMNLYSNFMELNEKNKFEIVFDYINKEFTYAHDCVESNGRLKQNCDYAQSSVKTYSYKKGISSGRSNLLTLVTNNSFLRLDCRTVYGICGSHQHAWNEFTDSKGNISNYDLSYNLKDKSKEEIEKREYKYNKKYNSSRVKIIYKNDKNIRDILKKKYVLIKKSNI